MNIDHIIIYFADHSLERERTDDIALEVDHDGNVVVVTETEGDKVSKSLYPMRNNVTGIGVDYTVEQPPLVALDVIDRTADEVA